MTLRAYLLQRITAAILAPLVLVHLIVIILAVQGGLTAEEILTRTKGSMGWGLYYGLFVLAAAIHAGIGLQASLREWLKLPPKIVNILVHSFMILLAALGARAVIAVTL